MYSPSDLLRKIPKTDRLLGHPALLAYVPDINDAVAEVLDTLRQQLLDKNAPTEMPSEDALAQQAVSLFLARRVPNLRCVVNATGIVLHTNLGRAPLAQEALDAMQQAAQGYSTLEYDIATGTRGSRHSHVDALLCQLTGTPAAMVVNNGAAAVLLALAALPQKEVPVSRGELVEIGGAFRVPDVMQASGCRLVEVGTTNRTHLRDYAAALSPDTGCILRVHTSNFKIVGFTAAPRLVELTTLAHNHGVPLVEDLGSGLLINLEAYGVRQPLVAHSLAAGVDVLTFSGDKLLGGPQAGIVLGHPEHIARMKQHPLARAFRMDKLSLAALEATLRLYLHPKTALQKIPVLRMLTATPQEIRHHAESWATAIAYAHPALQAEVVPSESQAGGGSVPGQVLPSFAVAVHSQERSPAALEKQFREMATPIIGRIHDGVFLLDMRSALLDMPPK